MSNIVSSRMLAVFVLICASRLLLASDVGAADTGSGTNFAVPTLLMGKIHDPSDQKLLFTFRRTVTVTNLTVVALREFFSTNGTLVACETVTYISNRFRLFELTEHNSGAHAKISVRNNPRSGQPLLVFEYAEAGKPTKTSTETLQPDTLNADMFGPFIEAHRAALLRGESVKFRFMVVSRRETIGFRVIKDSESTRDGKPVVILRMEPTSILISPFVDPLYFTVEKSGPHHIMDYTGQTTPRLKKDGTWTDVVAFTTFDWGR